MAISFLRVYSLVALCFSAFALPITAFTAWIAFSLAKDPSDGARLHLSPLSTLLLDNFRLFALAVCAYCLAGLIASVGLLRNRLWALQTWIALLGLAFLWNVGVAVSEVIHLTQTKLAGSAENFPLTANLAPLFSIPVALVMAAVLAWLIRRLILERRVVASGS